MESELQNFSLNFGNFENETPNERVKKMSEEELDKSVEDQKVSIQAGQLNLHYVPGKHGLNRSSLQFWAEFGYGKYLIVPFWYASAAYYISGSFGLAMGILARLRLAKIRTMARPNSPDMPPKRAKKVRLGI